MAKKELTQNLNQDGKALVIVESPAKARTIGKFLGPCYEVEASIGHIRDLPKGAKEVPEAYKKESWARLGVNVNDSFHPIYVIPDDKAKQIKKLKTLLKNVDALYLATDEDREGEAISWHLYEVLAPKVPVYRLVFHEITKNAINEALHHPRSIDQDLVRAQETRRIIDRLYGYEVSPLLWYKVRNNLSAGRVQSVAVRLIVDRERERMAFHAATYWNVLGNFSVPENVSRQNFNAQLFAVGTKGIPNGKDFDPKSGQLFKPEKFLLLNDSQTQELIQRWSSLTGRVDSVEEKPYVTRPYPPFTTSTLQQEANRKLGFTARTTMSVAQSLYENGYITYMRTDSTTLSSEAISAARTLVATHYGKEYLPASPRLYRTKVKNAQEAHEAIRPAGSSFPLPEMIQSRLSRDEFRLYDLIWKRTVASQMTDAHGKRKSIVIALDDARFQASGKTINFPGYLRAYVEGKDDPTAELADQEVILPDVCVGQELKCNRLTPQDHTTMPPQRFSEAALTHTLEEKGIGRPSTYASIIETILNRKYVFKKSNVLIPTWTAFAVCQLLETHFAELVDYQFTADMENHLDAISRGELEYLTYLKAFYFGNDDPKISKEINRAGQTAQSGQVTLIDQENPVEVHTDDSVKSGRQGEASSDHADITGLKPLIENKVGEIDARGISQIYIGTYPLDDGTQSEPIYVRVGRYGPFLQMGERQTSVPEELPPDELTVTKARELFDNEEKKDDPLGRCPETGKLVFLKTGRFGPYVQRGETDGEEKPQNASLLKGMNPAEIDLETALGLLSLPRTLGENPSNGEEVVASNGRFGPYIKCGSETRSLSGDLTPLNITLDQAVELLSKPKYGRRAATTKKSPPLQTFGESPVTGSEIQLLNGRFGPYLTDGQTNASLPKDWSIEEVTQEKALDLLAQRAAKGSTRRKTAKKTTRKAASSVAKKTTKTVTKKSTKTASAKTASAKTTAKTTAAKKTSAKTSTAEASTVKKTITKKPATKTTTATKTAAKKTTKAASAKTASAKETAEKKATAKKTTVKKATASKTDAKKTGTEAD